MTKKIAQADRVAGSVKEKLAFGAIVAFEGGDGLLHVSRMRGGSNAARARRLTQLRVGEQFEVEVSEIKQSGKSRKISLSERFHDERVLTDLPVGSEVSAVVKSVLEFGAIATIQDGIAAGVDGLVHVTEFAGATREVRDAALQATRVGTSLTAEVVSVAKDEQGDLRVRLSLKAPALRARLKTTFAPGTAHTGRVFKRADGGFLVSFGDLTGFLPESELGKAAASSVKVGGNVRAKVVSADERFRLTLTRRGL